MPGPLVIIGALLAAGTAVSARGQYVAGKIQEQELERQAEQERIAAEGRELQRREELNRALAARQMALATSGIAGEGTPQSIALGAAKTIGMGEGLETLSSQLKQSQLRRAGKMAASTGKIQAASTLLSGGAQALMIGGGGGGGDAAAGGGGT
jgi:hypothetical protein